MFNFQSTELQFTITIKDEKGEGQPLIVDFAKMHPSWVAAHLRKAAQRYLNDKYSGEPAELKLSMIRADLHDMHQGTAMPERERKAPQANKADAVLRLARELATSVLTAKFRAAFKTDAMETWAKNETAKKYLRFTDKGSARFDLAAVDAWIKSYAALPNGRDFMAEAREALATDESAMGAELDDLGL
jgi:hypothetical protein